MSDTATATVTVKRLILPVHMTFEQLAARTLLIGYHGDTFTDVENAPILFTESEILATETILDARGDLPIGCCKTSRFGGLHPALDVAKNAGVESNPELQALLASFNSGDKRAETGLAKLVSVANRKHGNRAEVVAWCHTAIDALMTRQVYSPVAVPGELSVSQIFEKIAKKEKFDKNKEAYEYLKLILHESDQYNHVPTELSYIVAALYRRPGEGDSLHYSPADVCKWVELIVNALYREQIEFQGECAKAMKVKPVMVKTLQGNRLRTLKLFFVKSDSDQAERAARKCGAHIVLVRRSDGHYMVSRSKKVRGLELKDAARMIEWLELPAKLKNKVKWSSLGTFTEEHGTDHWSVSESGNLHTGAPGKISLIAPDAMIDTLQHAFAFGFVKEWCNKRGIWMSDTPRSMMVRTPAVKKADAADARDTRSSKKNGTVHRHALETADAKAGNNDVAAALAEAKPIKKKTKRTRAAVTATN